MRKGAEMDQQVLFHEDINDALRAAVKACGGTKVVACRLWPEKTMNDAQSYLNDCLNSARPAKLSPEQTLLLLKWAREAGFHGALDYICSEAGYAQPVPIEPEDELTKLLREYLEGQKRGGTLQAKIDERIAKLRAVT
jgi:hypothetical protein